MLKLTGGQFRGRSLLVPKNELRPTLSRVRQALFNSLQSVTPEARVLDLFAGSGAFGFEALSRGASHVTFVDESRESIAVIKKNADTLGVAAQTTVVLADVLRFKPKSESSFDLILADPPYSLGFELKVLEMIPVWLNPGGVLVIESATRDGEWPDRLPGLEKQRDKPYGDTRLTHYTRV